MKRLPVILFLLLVAISGFGNGKKHALDSLKQVLTSEKEDSNKVNTYMNIGHLLGKGHDYLKADSVMNLAISLARKIAFKRGEAEALDYSEFVNWSRGEFSTALRNGVVALKLFHELGNTNHEASTLSHLAVIYCDLGDYPKALEYDLKCLKIYEKIGNKTGIANALSNTGNVYNYQNDHWQAMDYYLRSLKMRRVLGDKKNIATSLNNIGNVYDEQKEFTKALDYANQGLAMRIEIDDKTGMAASLSNIAAIYGNQEKYPQALDEFDKALALHKELMDKDGIAQVQCYKADLFLKWKKYKEAVECATQGIVTAQEVGAMNLLQDDCRVLSESYEQLGKDIQSLEYYKKYIVYRDSLFNKENVKKLVQSQMNYEFEQKHAAETAAQEKKDALAMQERNKQIFIRNSFIAGFVLMIALAFFIFRGYKQKQKANQIITLQKEEVENQKLLVEEKNKEILDSITYAKRLQDAILPPLSTVEHCLPDSFILYKPKDIVAGDFYWMLKSGDHILIAAADCTGHGVPGALVSIVCSNALDRAVKEFNITEPGKILDKVRELVVETFEKSESIVQDGMDISLCMLSPVKEGFSVSWSGANNPLWYIKDGAMLELTGDKQPVGKSDKQLPFSTHQLQLRKGDALYLFTDGYADQFGGPKGKKFKYQPLQELLIANAFLPMKAQRELLEKTLLGWRGNLEQVDDVLMIGIGV
jgi:serine phosphatase RsbU (regulator of sigma subunit)